MVNKICAVCGTSFTAKTERAKYCCDYCKNRSRYNRSRESYKSESEADKKTAINLYGSELSYKEIAAIIGRSPNFVYDAWREAGLSTKRFTRQQKNIMKLREQGKCSVEIAAELGISAKSVISTASVIGMPFSEEEKQRSIEIAHKRMVVSRFGDTEQRQIEFIADNYPGWQYVSGILSGDGYVKLQCNTCGSIVKKSATTVRRKRLNIICPVCLNCHKQEQKLKKEAERKERARQKEKKFWSQDFQQITFNCFPCKECGAYYIGKKPGYCSDACRRKHVNRVHDKRLLRANSIDRSISLEKLYKRDNGICWLCGEKCDYGDCVTDKNGNFVVGANYPSIDHIYPLSKGGNHEWDNVKLAHHHCNTLKSNKVVLYG